MLRHILAALCFSLAGGHAIADTKGSKAATKRRDVQTAQGGSSTLINGTPADVKDWPASVYASMSGASCSATVVGDRVLLIAAHCVSNGGTASFTVLGNRYSSKCTHHPSYRGNSTADWTLCLVDKPVTGIKFENINKDSSVVKLNDDLQLTGYGCIRAGGGGGNDGIFRIGTAKVRELAQPGQSDYDIVTVGGAALCYGDSGGAAYKWLDAAKTKRVIVGVNSRGNIATTSYLPDYATTAFQGWAASWQASNAQKICGLDAAATNCRDSGGQPDPDPKPFKCQAQLDAVSKALGELNSCVKAP